MEQKPSVGRIVHYYIEDRGEPLAAIVTGVRPERTDIVDLSVFPPPHGGGLQHPDPEKRITCSYSPEPRAKCWTWPPRV